MLHIIINFVIFYYTIVVHLLSALSVIAAACCFWRRRKTALLTNETSNWTRLVLSAPFDVRCSVAAKQKWNRWTLFSSSPSLLYLDMARTPTISQISGHSLHSPPPRPVHASHFIARWVQTSLPWSTSVEFCLLTTYTASKIYTTPVLFLCESKWFLEVIKSSFLENKRKPCMCRSIWNEVVHTFLFMTETIIIYYWAVYYIQRVPYASM